MATDAVIGTSRMTGIGSGRTLIHGVPRRCRSGRLEEPSSSYTAPRCASPGRAKVTQRTKKWGAVRMVVRLDEIGLLANRNEWAVSPDRPSW